ncbi:MAG: hypothetical protein KBD94_09185 [Pyrinomonadaceae bacterium]|nr:hypothetical protein [Pyrinomonadaceae bacterium]
MLKRLVSILFVFAIVGQIYAGVCGCLGGDDNATHSCCKRSKAAGDAIKAKDCCAADCEVQQADRLTQDRSNPTPQIKLQADEPSTPLPAISVQWVAVTSSITTRQLADHHLKHPRPPDLYLRHHAFLI